MRVLRACVPCVFCRVAPARIACLDMNLQKARMQMGVQVRLQGRAASATLHDFWRMGVLLDL